jgi:hypothetical protein
MVVGCMRVESFGAAFQIQQCYFHCKQAMRRKRDKLVDKAHLQAFEADVSNCHRAVSPAAFSNLTCTMIANWKEQGEVEYATWFSKTYLAEDWKTWSCWGTSEAGCGTTNNCMESFNRKLKIYLNRSLTPAEFTTYGIR